LKADRVLSMKKIFLGLLLILALVNGRLILRHAGELL
jgi:hypothetical protein